MAWQAACGSKSWCGARPPASLSLSQGDSELGGRPAASTSLGAMRHRQPWWPPPPRESWQQEQDLRPAAEGLPRRLWLSVHVSSSSTQPGVPEAAAEAFWEAGGGERKIQIRKESCLSSSSLQPREAETLHSAAQGVISNSDREKVCPFYR